MYIGEHLPSKCHFFGIEEMISEEILMKYDLTVLHCNNHDETFEKKIVKSIVKLFINYWCTEVNRFYLIRYHCNLEEMIVSNN